MKRAPFGVETKTAASTSIAGVVTLILLLNSWQHWFVPPPPGTIAAIEAVLVGVVGYFAKHTPRPELAAQPPVINVTGDPTKQPAIITLDGPVSEADLEKLKSDWRRVFGVQMQPAVQVQYPASATAVNAPAVQPSAEEQARQARAVESERRWIEARKQGGYTGGGAAEDMAPPPTDVPSLVQPPATTTGGAS
jgi:hypothetical protein